MGFARLATRLLGKLLSENEVKEAVVGVGLTPQEVKK